MNMKFVGAVVVVAVAFFAGWAKYGNRSNNLGLEVSIRQNTQGDEIGTITNTRDQSVTITGGVMNGRDDDPSCTLVPTGALGGRLMTEYTLSRLTVVTETTPASFILQQGDQLEFGVGGQCGSLSRLSLSTTSGEAVFDIR